MTARRFDELQARFHTSQPPPRGSPAHAAQWGFSPLQFDGLGRTLQSIRSKAPQPHDDGSDSEVSVSADNGGWIRYAMVHMRCICVYSCMRFRRNAYTETPH